MNLIEFGKLYKNQSTNVSEVWDYSVFTYLWHEKKINLTFTMFDLWQKNISSRPIHKTQILIFWVSVSFVYNFYVKAQLLQSLLY